jgi:hypothetical protein
VLGSLTLGGYDQSRFEPNNVTFPFDPDDDRSVSVNIQSIVAKDSFSGSSDLLDLDQPTYVQIDYTVPHLWLPTPTCDRIASAFMLQYDRKTDLYLVNDTVHGELQKRNPTITIGLGATADPTQRVNIVFPYSAFDLQASYPIYNNATNYFPIRRAYNESMYTLGRAFLQEAYLKVDYERENFSVYQALFPATNEERHVVPITAPNSEPSNPAIQSRHKLERGAITGVVIGIVALLALVKFAFLCYFRKRYTKKNETQLCNDNPSKELPSEGRHEKDGPALFEADGIQYYELYYEGLEMVVNASPRFELSGSVASHELVEDQGVTLEPDLVIRESSVGNIEKSHVP